MAHVKGLEKGKNRKKIFLFSNFQIRYVVLVAGSLTVLLIMAGVHGYFWASNALSGEALNQLKPDLVASTVRLFIVGFLYVAIVSLASIFLTHRSVGPTRRLEEELERMAESRNDLDPIHVRDGDELVGLTEAINKLIEKRGKK